MSILLLVIFGLASGTLFSVFVALVGRNRRIGFGWAFVLSLILTPLLGLIITLLSDPLPEGDRQSWGCLATTFIILGSLLFVPVLMALLGMLGVGATLLAL